MDEVTRCALQRQKAREAIGVLRGVSELFGIEVEPGAKWRDSDPADLRAWESKLDEFEKWVWDESPIA